MSLICEASSLRDDQLSSSHLPLDFASDRSVSRLQTEAAVDRKTAREVSRLLATLIGEIMEDHAEIALSLDFATARRDAQRLARAGEDIAGLAGAIEVIARRAER
jgi:hypothetical protein